MKWWELVGVGIFGAIIGAVTLFLWELVVVLRSWYDE